MSKEVSVTSKSKGHDPLSLWLPCSPVMNNLNRRTWLLRFRVIQLVRREEAAEVSAAGEPEPEEVEQPETGREQGAVQTSRGHTC